MTIAVSKKLKERNGGICELCASEDSTIAYAVSPANNDAVENEVALCNTCMSLLSSKDAGSHWQCLAGSIWSTVPSVQALSYRILYGNKDREWANEIMNSVEPDEEVVNWALTAYQTTEVHRDTNGNILRNGDTIVFTQGLNVKGANFMVPKGAIVRKIKLVPNNTEQIEGKINDQTIVILTKYVRKS